MKANRSRQGAWLGLALVMGLASSSGCASVQAYQRERLADRIMSFEGDARFDARRMKSFEAREGSTGGGGGAGGGCACSN